MAPSTGTWATSSRPPSTVSAPDQPRPSSAPPPRVSRAPIAVGLVELTIRPSASATVTEVTPDWVCVEFTSAAKASCGAGRGSWLRTSGLAASCSASATTRRPSTRSKVAPDWARETAATASSTITTMASWSTSISPARV